MKIHINSIPYSRYFLYHIEKITSFLYFLDSLDCTYKKNNYDYLPEAYEGLWSIYKHNPKCDIITDNYDIKINIPKNGRDGYYLISVKNNAISEKITVNLFEDFHRGNKGKKIDNFFYRLSFFECKKNICLSAY